MKSKQQLRLEAKEIKKHMNLSEISRVIQSGILDVLSGINADCVMLYMPLRDEIDTSYIFEILSRNSIKCCFPVIEDDCIIPKLCKDKCFSSGRFGILEPKGETVDCNSINVIVVPGVMFDVNCRRLGRGGGYYDRFLNKTNALKIGICPDELLINKLPVENHDIAVDMVVTEKRKVIYAG